MRSFVLWYWRRMSGEKESERIGAQHSWLRRCAACFDQGVGLLSRKLFCMVMWLACEREWEKRAEKETNGSRRL